MDNLNHLNYRVIGSGYPVLFLHGFLESIEMWRYFSLENKFKCILVDLPGHGQSEFKTGEAVSMDSIAKEIIEIIDFLEIDTFGIVGHSMGGYVGLEIVQKDVRCEKVVLLNSNFWNDTDLKKRDRRRVAEIVKKNKKLFLYEAIPNLFNYPEKYNLEIRKLIEEAQQMNIEAIGETSIAMANRKSFENYLGLIADKLLIIQGEFDSIVPFERMKTALTNHPIIQFRLVGSGHMAHIESTIETQEIIEGFFK